MIGVLVVLLISVIPAMFIAEAVARQRRLAKWQQGRSVIRDDQFYASLGGTMISRDAAIKVRSVVGDAVKIQAELISASDNILELERAGRCSHGSIVDYFADFFPIKEPASTLVTVRDLVIEFGAQMEAVAGAARLT
jgi:hypothetical protein